MSKEKFILTSCSTADMPEEFFTERKIPYCCFHYILDGKEYPDDLGKTMSFDEFYKKVKGGAMPTTSQINMDQFIDFFEPFLRDGYDVLHLSLSSGLSGVCNSARLAAEQLCEQYPENRVVIIDTLSASSGFGLLVDMAADLRDEGKSFDEIRDWVEDNKFKIHHWFFSTDLTHFKRGGRISSASCIAGTVLNICPLMHVDTEGKLVQVEKVRGKKKVIERIVDKMAENADDGQDYSGKCFISHSACDEDARIVADMITERFKNLSEPVRICSIGTVIGSHSGPGTVAVFFHGGER